MANGTILSRRKVRRKDITRNKDYKILIYKMSYKLVGLSESKITLVINGDENLEKRNNNLHL